MTMYPGICAIHHGTVIVPTPVPLWNIIPRTLTASRAHKASVYIESQLCYSCFRLGTTHRNNNRNIQMWGRSGELQVIYPMRTQFSRAGMGGGGYGDNLRASGVVMLTKSWHH